MGGREDRPVRSTTKPEPSSSVAPPGFAPKYEKTVTTPGAAPRRSAAARSRAASTGFETTTVAGSDERTSGSRTRTVCAPPLVPAAALDGEQHPSGARERSEDAQSHDECRTHAPG